MQDSYQNLQRFINEKQLKFFEGNALLAYWIVKSKPSKDVTPDEREYLAHQIETWSQMSGKTYEWCKNQTEQLFADYKVWLAKCVPA